MNISAILVMYCLAWFFVGIALFRLRSPKQMLMTKQTTDEKLVEAVKDGKLSLREFAYRLLFTRDDDLDILQLLFMLIIVTTLVISWVVMVEQKESFEAVKVEALVTLRWLAGLLVITAVPKWLTPTMKAILTKGKFGGTSKRDTEEDSPYADGDGEDTQ